MNKEKILRKQIRLWIWFFIISILLSGVTAFPIESELHWLNQLSSAAPEPFAVWITNVYTAVHETNKAYPFLSYGTDWLAFAHIIIALLFIGPLRDPVRNKWIIEWGMICCILVFPLALIAGPVRGIPFFHRLIDCTFGAIGLIPLIIVKQKIKKLEALISF